VTGLDCDAARSEPGVAAVFSAADLPDALRIPIRLYPLPGMERFLQPPLASDRVRYQGEPVAVVVASDRYRAEDAAELVAVEYDPLDAVVDASDGLAAGVPRLFEEAGTNLAGELHLSHGDVDGAFAGAAHVVSETVRCRGRTGASRSGAPPRCRTRTAASWPGCWGGRRSGSGWWSCRSAAGSGRGASSTRRTT
jgi:CO/xanthine dehydrogenase Mo-binding subunit